MKKARVRSEKLSKGMVTATDVVSIVGVTIVPKRTVLDIYNIDKICKSGVTAVVVEADEDGNAIIRGSNFSSVDEVKNSKEFKKFKENFEITKNEIKYSLDKVVGSEGEINIDKMIAEVDVIMSNISNGMEIFEMLNCMKDEMDDVYKHSLSVSLMSAIIAKWARIAKKDIDDIIAAALLHDVGKIKVSREILKNPTPSSEDRKFLRKHAIYGYNILKGRVDEQIAQVALRHHERYDGSDYPMAQKGMEIPKMARIISIADVFDELTSKKSTNTIDSCPFEVIKLFEIDGFQKFDTEYLLVFLSGISDTYIGYKVRLSNNKVGTIVFTNKIRPSRPMVKVDNRYIDLVKEPGLNIVEVL